MKTEASREVVPELVEFDGQWSWIHPSGFSTGEMFASEAECLANWERSLPSGKGMFPSSWKLAQLLEVDQTVYRVVGQSTPPHITNAETLILLQVDDGFDYKYNTVLVPSTMLLLED